MPRISKSDFIKLQKKLGTDEAIGKKFGITRQAVFQIRRKYAIKSRIAENPERNRKIVKLYKKGMSGVKIAEKSGLSISQTYRVLHEAGAMKK